MRAHSTCVHTVRASEHLVMDDDIDLSAFKSGNVTSPRGRAARRIAQ
ncbi:unannotated protein [freshwater metagenome]|uniref:Unannotated protein n=1 Tax=freshwater metagenome TaxID=449393 RepID=A0A6J7FK46_9ZZZZ|nr:hypothetical protein [Actinomycetota bacterium]